jgi:beta-lactam-binding protein with PASTA domain
VIAQDPPAHAQNIGQPTVNLLVAVPDTETADGYVMPDLVGRLAVSAVAQLGQAGIKATAKYVTISVGKIANSGPMRPPVPPGAVTAQAPAAGERVDQGTVVQLFVAK